MKKLSMLLFGMTLLFVAAFSCFSGCDSDSVPSGTLCSLEEVYAAQGIDRDDLLNIAYHNGDQERNQTEMQNFEPTPIGELSEEISVKIRECVTKNDHNDGILETTAENILIENYLGCYNGYYAFRFSNSLYDYPEWVEDPEDYTQEVGGIKFSCWHTSSILLWKEN